MSGVPLSSTQTVSGYTPALQPRRQLWSSRSRSHRLSSQPQVSNESCGSETVLRWRNGLPRWHGPDSAPYPATNGLLPQHIWILLQKSCYSTPESTEACASWYQTHPPSTDGQHALQLPRSPTSGGEWAAEVLAPPQSVQTATVSLSGQTGSSQAEKHVNSRINQLPESETPRPSKKTQLWLCFFTAVVFYFQIKMQRPARVFNCFSNFCQIIVTKLNVL